MNPSGCGDADSGVYIASDRFGRKPVILVGMLSVMLASLLFGFSQTLAWAITARAFAGSVNGNVGIIRTTVAEMVPAKELQPRAFSVMPLVWTIGSIFGPGFGGALANPAVKYPQLFGRSDFFKNYPFALPNMVSSIFFLIGLATGFLFLKETLLVHLFVFYFLPGYSLTPCLMTLPKTCLSFKGRSGCLLQASI